VKTILRARFSIAIIGLLVAGFLCTPLVTAGPKDSTPPPEITDKSDLNGDGWLNIDDLVIFSGHYLEVNWETADWCGFYTATTSEQRYQGKITSYYLKNFGMLLGFIYDHFSCTGPSQLLAVKNQPRTLTRIAHDELGSGNYYVSDTQLGSVFIYEPGLTLIGEIKNLSKPLGLAIDSQGYLLVGNNGRDNIEVYDPTNGDRLAIIGEGLVKMPNTINIDSNGNIYVTDSKAHRIWVFDPDYVHIRTIGEPGSGEGQLKFPSDADFVGTQVTVRKKTVLVEQLFVTDQGNRRIQVFDLDGTHVRSIYPLLTLSDICLDWGWGCPTGENYRGSFNRLQAIEVDALGRLNVLDIFEAAVTIIDPETDLVVGSYGGWGAGASNLRSPLDVLVTGSGTAIVTDNGKDELKEFVIP
jgi:hypothetical protein